MKFWDIVEAIFNSLNEFKEEVKSNEKWASKQSNSELQKNYSSNSNNSLAKKAAVIKEAQKRGEEQKKNK